MSKLISWVPGLQTSVFSAGKNPNLLSLILYIPGASVISNIPLIFSVIISLRADGKEETLDFMEKIGFVNVSGGNPVSYPRFSVNKLNRLNTFVVGLLLLVIGDDFQPPISQWLLHFHVFFGRLILAGGLIGLNNGFIGNYLQKREVSVVQLIIFHDRLIVLCLLEHINDLLESKEMLFQARSQQSAILHLSRRKPFSK